MILTCPACDTKYVVKEGAIPPGGRQVRCASCKHRWHQEADPIADASDDVPMAIASLGGPPEPAISEPAAEQPVAEAPPSASTDQNIAGEPQPEIRADQYAEVEEIENDWRAPTVAAPPPSPHTPAPEDAVAPASAAPVEQWHEPQPAEDEAEHVGYVERYLDEDDRPKRRWPLVLLGLFLIAVAAAAFWFLAPPEWKARAGIAQGISPLQLMITTSDRQPLESGNELVAISGRVINPTDIEQQVPPIRAELRNKQTKELIHQWTIAPPTRVLAPRSSASFNSAEVDVPEGGDELTVTLGV